MDLEEHLHRNGTRIIKIFLHLSKDEQRKRFLERIDEPDKNWKFSLADIHERKYWKHYMKAYEACLNATSTHHAPWYVVPADDKDNARLIVSQIVLDALNELKMAYPKTTAKRRRELENYPQTALKANLCRLRRLGLWSCGAEQESKRRRSCSSSISPTISSRMSSSVMSPRILPFASRTKGRPSAAGCSEKCAMNKPSNYHDCVPLDCRWRTTFHAKPSFSMTQMTM